MFHYHHAHHFLSYGCEDAFLLRLLVGAIILAALFSRPRGIRL